MKRQLMYAVFIGVVTGAVSAHSQKTYLAPRPSGVNKAMEMIGWHQRIFMPYNGSEHTIKTHLKKTLFYQESESENKLGRYFGIGNCKDCFTIGNPGTPDDMFPDTLFETNLDGALFIHNVDAGGIVAQDAHAQAQVALRPRREVIGLRCDFFQDITTPIKGLFFKASMPLAYVRHNIRLNNPCDEECGGDDVKVTVDGKKFTLRDFFAGCVEIKKGQADTDCNLQAPLTHAKFKNCSRSSFGIADLDIALGYKFVYTKKSHLFASCGLTIPTGRKVRSEYLFDSIYGNGHHVGLISGIDAGMRMWEGKAGMLRADLSLYHKYLFEGTQARTVGIKCRPFGHYYLAGCNRQQNEQLFPLANILTRDVRIQPGHLIDMLCALNFQSSRFVVDVSYNMYWHDRESAWLKNPLPECTYGIAKSDYKTNQVFDTDHMLGERFLTNDDLDLDAVKTPEQLTHKISGGLTYKWSCKGYPSSCGFGASYEFAQNNAALENYALWLHGALSF